MPFNLIFDEFQEFYNINPAIFSEIQNIWDQTKDNTHVNLLVCGSVYTLMHRIFQDSKEPLYGRASGFIKLKPFMPSVLKQILKDHNPNYSNDDLLALYATTGGVPKYVELLMDNGCVKVQSILERMCGENSLFLEEGNTVLIQEMGKQYGTYYSVLSAIASGATESSRISQLTGVASLGGIMQRLEEDYDLVGKKRPVLSKPGSQTVRYEIKDHFLRFWFRYIVKYQNLIQTGQWESLKDIVVQDYPTYSGKELEAYFKDKLCEELPIGQIGSWWESNRSKTNDNDQHEVDIVAIYLDRPKVLIAEVKRDKRNFKKKPFEEKVELLRNKYFDKYEVETRCFSLSDM
jgi:AAA+ ATPase superfamily predicted ATPase